MQIAIFILLVLFSGLVFGKNKPYTSISDCTDKAWDDNDEYFSMYLNQTDIEDYFKVKKSAKDIDIKNSALVQATEWSKDNGFLPCSISMCGMVGYSEAGSIVVFIKSYDDHAFYAPSAFLALKSSGNKSSEKKSMILHSGCSKYE